MWTSTQKCWAKSHSTCFNLSNEYQWIHFQTHSFIDFKWRFCYYFYQQGILQGLKSDLLSDHFVPPPPINYSRYKTIISDLALFLTQSLKNASHCFGFPLKLMLCCTFHTFRREQKQGGDRVSRAKIKLKPRYESPLWHHKLRAPERKLERSWLTSEAHLESRDSALLLGKQGDAWFPLAGGPRGKLMGQKHPGPLSCEHKVCAGQRRPHGT